MREEKGEEGKEESKKKGEEAMEESEKRKHEEEEDKKLDLRNGQGATGTGPGEHSSDGQGGLGIGKSMTPEVPDPFAGSMVGTVAGMSKQEAKDTDPEEEMNQIQDSIERFYATHPDFKRSIPSSIDSAKRVSDPFEKGKEEQESKTPVTYSLSPSFFSLSFTIMFICSMILLSNTHSHTQHAHVRAHTN
jgi:hypothetical protein